MPSERSASGKRRFKVTIQQVTDDVGESGEPIETWTTLCQPFASRDDVDAPERFTEGIVMEQVSARAWMQWRIPYRQDMDPLRVDIPKKRRLSYLGRIYDIAAATLTDRNDQVKLLTLAKVG